MERALQYTIDDEICSQASYCRQGKVCLSDPEHRMCAVTQCVNREVLFVCGTNRGICDYRMSFGNSYICSCPIRIELYRQHKV
jgi:hypothetical protein